MKPRNRLGFVLAVVGGLLASGCLAHPALKDDSASLNAALLLTLDVDLHDYVLNITMPEGQPTMLVALNVTKDMWVRPRVGISPTGFPVDDTRSWILCPWVQSMGVPADAGWTSAVFWQEGNTLVPTGVLSAADQSNPDGPGGCVSATVWDAGIYAVSSDMPYDRILWILLTARPTRPDNGSWSSPAFSFRVGIAASTCERTTPNSPRTWTYCPPSKQVEAAPMVRGGAPSFSEFVDGKPCQQCGFKINDGRIVGRGALGLERDGAIQPAIVMAFVGFGTEGVHMYVTADGGSAQATCADRTGNGFGSAFASNTQRFSLRVTWDATGVKSNLAGRTDSTPLGSFGDRLRILEVPVDLTSLGLNVEPFVRLFSGHPSPASGTTTGFCP